MIGRMCKSSNAFSLAVLNPERLTIRFTRSIGIPKPTPGLSKEISASLLASIFSFDSGSKLLSFERMKPFRISGTLDPNNKLLGDYSEGVTPVPIPNTEVKPLSPDGTALVTVWESRTSPGLNQTP